MYSVFSAFSMSHNSGKLYKKGQFVPEMKETLALIQDITGSNPKLGRPPYGSALGLKSKEFAIKLQNLK